MSVALFSARELGAFAATIAHLELATLDQAIGLAESVAHGNAAAWNSQYNESEKPLGREGIADVASRLVGDEDELVAAGLGPFVYNMADNNGTYYVAPGVEIGGDETLLAVLRDLEKRCRDWREGKARELARKEKNAVAYNDVGQLPTKTVGELRAECEALGYTRLICARFSVNESDPMTDYYGGRQTRTVVIGFGKGKRESFKQLRKAAESFGPTKHLGPGKDEVTAYAYGADEETRESKYVPSHALKDDRGLAIVFSNEVLAREYVDILVSEFESDVEAGKVEYPRCCEFVDYASDHGYSVSVNSYENRENYSMGGGNYLGSSRYSGWKVETYYGSDENVVEVTDFDRTPAKSVKRTKKPKASAEIVRHEVTEKGVHGLTVKIRKRVIEICYSDFRNTTIGVSISRGRMGKWFGGWDEAKGNYQAENIKTAIQAAQDAVLTRLGKDCDASSAGEPKPVSVDSSDIDWLAWL